LPRIKMVVLDFDGVIVESGRGEKIWRWLAKKIRVKTPKIFFFLQEIIEDEFNIRSELIGETIEYIKILNQNNCLVGLLTDRSLWSLDMFFSKNNRLINFNKFAFVQGRKSVLNRLVKKLPLKTVFFESKETKPNAQMFQNLKRFAKEKNIELQEIMVIDDLPAMIELARTNGLSVPPTYYYFAD